MSEIDKKLLKGLMQKRIDDDEGYEDENYSEGISESETVYCRIVVKEQHLIQKPRKTKVESVWAAQNSSRRGEQK